MAFKQVLDLDCDKTISLGGVDKRTNKANPRAVEGYFIGSKDTPSKKAKNGIAKLHIFQTSEGSTGVWGKTDLDRKLLSVPAGAMTRITQTGKVPTANGDMFKYKVEVDEDNSIEVNLPSNNASDETQEESQGLQRSDQSDDEDLEETDFDQEETRVDEVQPVRAAPPKKAATAPDAARQAKVQALLNGKSRAA